ncbi:hypothetical protein [Spirosoma sp.]|uniref:hypothetical protein n=1 Tax=Spirosoma sp. TaxID=1899569 RepID=UPI003B3A48E8
MWLQLIGTFFRQHWKVILIGLAIGGISYLVYLAFDNSTTINSLKSYLGSARDSLSRSILQINRLKVDSTRLENKYLLAEKGRLEKSNEAELAKIAGLQAQEAFARRDQQNYEHVASLTAIQKKQAADLGVMRQRLGLLPTSVNDSATNGIVATMAGTIAILDSTNQKQASAVGTLAAENKTLVSKNQTLTADNADLKNDLSAVYNTMADKLEEVKRNKKFANINLGKDLQKAANDIRAGRVRTRKP